MKVQIKKIGLKDLPLLRTISLTTFTEAFYSKNNPEDFYAYTSMAFTDEKLKSELAENDSEFFFIYEDEILAGYFKLNKFINHLEKYDPGFIELQRIYISKEFQSTGLGAYTVKYILEYVKNLRFKTLWLGVWEHNSGAIRFYKRMGFKEVGSHDFKLGSSLQRDILCSLDL